MCLREKENAEIGILRNLINWSAKQLHYSLLLITSKNPLYKSVENSEK